MGLGAWQATCSALGSFRKWRTTRQNSVMFVSPCRKSNAPGPARGRAAHHGLLSLPTCVFEAVKRSMQHQQASASPNKVENLRLSETMQELFHGGVRLLGK